MFFRSPLFVWKEKKQNRHVYVKWELELYSFLHGIKKQRAVSDLLAGRVGGNDTGHSNAAIVWV